MTKCKAGTSSQGVWNYGRKLYQPHLVNPLIDTDPWSKCETCNIKPISNLLQVRAGAGFKHIDDKTSDIHCWSLTSQRGDISVPDQGSSQWNGD